MRLFLTAFLLAGETSLQAGSPWSVLWAAPGIIVASLMIAWGAEATQFFIAQGLALAILALLQTLPEFAVEAVLAWDRQVPYLYANLTGALMLLTGIGWPMIYFSAARSYRREHKRPMRRIQLAEEHALQLLGLLGGILWQLVIWWKGYLTVYDGILLILIYAAYLWVMGRLPAEKSESIDEIGAVPRAIVLASRARRITAIFMLFIVGGAAVFLIAGPFLAGLYGLSMLLGISYFHFIQWIAPLISEAPEGISAFYWARDPGRASIALMNLVSSNINQWTLLAGLLPMVLSVSAGHISSIPLDAEQSQDLLLTLSQSLLGALFLVNLELTWWEAAGLFLLFVAQFAYAPLHPFITWIDFAWCALELVRLVTGKRKAMGLRGLGRLLSRQ